MVMMMVMMVMVMILGVVGACDGDAGSGDVDD